MPPTLRSANTTPVKGTASTASTSPSSSTPRKQHQCRTCGRPRAGHPRQGCPFEGASTQVVPEVITDALQSMNIDVDSSPVPASKQKKRRGRASSEKKPQVFPSASLASLSTTSKELLERLKQPGIMSDSGDEEDGAEEDGAETKRKILESLTNAERSKRSRTRMPGALDSPTQSLFASTQETRGPEPASPSPDLSQPIVRSLSTEEREAFLVDLNEASKVPPACVYVFPMRDIPRIKRSAEKVGFHACVVSAETNQTDGWLVLGREKRAVQLLRAEMESKRSTDVRGGTLRAVAGGAVVGAVATFTGLAFS